MCRIEYLFGTRQFETFVSCIVDLALPTLNVIYPDKYFNVAARGFADQGIEPNVSQAQTNKQYEE
jgi:hypothetical protein